MKNYFYQNTITQLDYVPKGYTTSDIFDDRFTSFVELTEEQNTFFANNPTANVFEVRDCEMKILEPILPTLEERKKELKEKFEPLQDMFTIKLAHVSETLGVEHDYTVRLKNICRVRREMTIQAIDNFTTIEEAMLFDIRESDAEPILNAISIIRNASITDVDAMNTVGNIIEQIEQALNIR